MANQSKSYKHISVGIDESYARCGISISADGIPLKCTSTSFPGCETKSQKRVYLSAIVSTILEKNLAKANVVTITVERIRTFTGSKQQQGDSGFGGLRPKYLIATGALIGSIVDTASRYNVPVYSTTTLSWKTQILGSAKVSPKDLKRYEKPEKASSIRYAQSFGFDLRIKDKNGQPKVHSKGKLAGMPYYDDDAADSLGISMSVFNRNCKSLYVLEE
jgi:hypothetical protein